MDKIDLQLVSCGLLFYKSSLMFRLDCLLACSSSLAEKYSVSNS